jgi:REP element-mobilizing transposase RayT
MAASVTGAIVTFKSLHDPCHAYFVTATIDGWRPILASRGCAHVVTESLAWLRREGRIRLFAFVVMPSHVHALLRPVERRIGEVVRDFGSFTAHEIVRVLREDGEERVEPFRQPTSDGGYRHRIWRKIQAKNVFSQRFVLQKLEYIHNNPVRCDPPLAADRADYRFSSACFYDRGTTPMIEIDPLESIS